MGTQTRARNTFYDWTTIKDAMARNKPNTAGVPNGAPRRSPNIFKTRKKLIAHYYHVYWMFYRSPNKLQTFFLGSKIVKSLVKFGPKIVLRTKVFKKETTDTVNRIS